MREVLNGHRKKELSENEFFLGLVHRKFLVIVNKSYENCVACCGSDLYSIFLCSHNRIKVHFTVHYNDNWDYSC